MSQEKREKIRGLKFFEAGGVGFGYALLSLLFPVLAFGIAPVSAGGIGLMAVAWLVAWIGSNVGAAAINNIQGRE